MILVGLIKACRKQKNVPRLSAGTLWQWNDWCTQLITCVQCLKLKSQLPESAACPLVPFPTSGLLSGCVFNPPNLLGPEPLRNMFSIINLVKMEAARHPSDLLHTQAWPCSVHLHDRPSCCRAQKVRHTQQLTSCGLTCTGSLWSWLTGGDDSSTTRGWEKSGVPSGATCYVNALMNPNTDTVGEKQR